MDFVAITEGVYGGYQELKDLPVTELQRYFKSWVRIKDAERKAIEAAKNA